MNTPLVIVNEPLAATRTPEWQKAIMRDVLKRDMHFFDRNPRARLRVRPYAPGEVYPDLGTFTHCAVVRVDAEPGWKILRLPCTEATLPETVVRANALLALGGVM